MSTMTVLIICSTIVILAILYIYWQQNVNIYTDELIKTGEVVDSRNRVIGHDYFYKRTYYNGKVKYFTKTKGG